MQMRRFLSDLALICMILFNKLSILYLHSQLSRLPFVMVASRDYACGCVNAYL